MELEELQDWVLLYVLPQVRRQPLPFPSPVPVWVRLLSRSVPSHHLEILQLTHHPRGRLLLPLLLPVLLELPEEPEPVRQRDVKRVLPLHRSTLLLLTLVLRCLLRPLSVVVHGRYGVSQVNPHSPGAPSGSTPVRLQQLRPIKGYVQPTQGLLLSTP